MVERYGMPYKGSKNQIAERIVAAMPPAENFYDLFCGGCAVTHAAMLSGKWRNFHINDIIPGQAQLFKDCVEGRHADRLTHWVTREEFNATKDTDRLNATCWSFGNNGKDYLYGAHLEPYKRAYHMAACFGDLTEFHALGIYPPEPKDADVSARHRGLARWIRANHDKVKAAYTKWYAEMADGERRKYEDILRRVIGDLGASLKSERDRLRQMLLDALRESGLTQSEVQRRLGTQMSGHYFGNSQWAFPTFEMYTRMREFMPLPPDYFAVTNFMTILQSLQSLESLQRLESLESLQRLQSLAAFRGLTATCADYRDIEIRPDSVIYCDIPYRGTSGYGDDTGKDKITTFDHEAFYDWAERQAVPVYISEYSMP